MDRSAPNSLDNNVLLSTLEILRQGRPIGPEHPLADFISFHDPLLHRLPIREDIRRSTEIWNGIAAVIRRKLNDYRSLYNLLPASGDETQDVALQSWIEDFRHSNIELEMWSLLYHRFVYLEIGLPLYNVCKSLGQTKRTLNRRQKSGMSRLTSVLINQELIARRVAIDKFATMVMWQEHFSNFPLPRHDLLHLDVLTLAALPSR